MSATQSTLFIVLSLTASLAAAPPETAPASSEVDFSRQLIPMLTQAGCNSGACHGAAAGRGYLKLSLYGSRPQEDFETILHAPGGRLIDLEAAELSLLLQKPTGYLEHGGETRIDSDGSDYKLLRQWIQAGCPPGTMTQLQSIDITPSQSVQLRTGDSTVVRVNAIWEDGTSNAIPAGWVRTDGASPNADDKAASLSVQPEGTQLRFTANAPGYWPVTIRVGKIAQTMQFWVAPSTNQRLNAADATASSIDALVDAASRRIGKKPLDRCPPELLARRLWIDLLGQHPPLDAWRAATQQIASGRLPELVDQLLASPEFYARAGQEITSWATSTGTRRGAANLQQQLAEQLSQQLRQDSNLLQLARDMLRVPESSAEQAGSALLSFHQLANDPRSRAEWVASTWMGVRIGCAQCHDHPLDHWTQDDYFGLAACWSEIESTGKVRRITGRTTTDLRSGRVAIAKLPDTSDIYQGDQAADLALVDWLTSGQNEIVAHNLVNRIWLWTTGQAIVDEPDDQRTTNPPINPSLMDYLTQRLQAENFRLEPLLREIVLSQTYARRSLAAQPPLDYRLGIARSAKPIGLPMPELIAQMLNVDLSDLPSEHSEDSNMMMAAEQDSCTRGQACDDPFASSLQLVAGDGVNALIRLGVNAACESAPTLPPLDLIEQLYVRAFGIPPTAQNRQQWQGLLDQLAAPNPDTSSPQTRELIEDLVWSWVVSPAFGQLH